MIYDGQDMAQILSKFWFHYLRLMALPVMKESSYLDTSGYFRSFSLSPLVSLMSVKSVISQNVLSKLNSRLNFRILVCSLTEVTCWNEGELQKVLNVAHIFHHAAYLMHDSLTVLVCCFSLPSDIRSLPSPITMVTSISGLTHY